MSKFIISIQVMDEQELYSRLDPSGLSFSSELTEYLSDSIEDRRLGEGGFYRAFSGISAGYGTL